MRRRITEQEINFLREKAATTPRDVIAKQLGVWWTAQKVNDAIRRLRERGVIPTGDSSIVRSAANQRRWDKTPPEVKKKVGEKIGKSQTSEHRANAARRGWENRKNQQQKPQ